MEAISFIPSSFTRSPLSLSFFLAPHFTLPLFSKSSRFLVEIIYLSLLILGLFSAMIFSSILTFYSSHCKNLIFFSYSVSKYVTFCFSNCKARISCYLVPFNFYCYNIFFRNILTLSLRSIILNGRICISFLFAFSYHPEYSTSHLCYHQKKCICMFSFMLFSKTNSNLYI